MGDRPVLVAHIQDEFYAVAAHCSHAGAPLETGVVSDHRIICPWHNACFDLCTGQQQEPPGLNDLARFETWVSEGKVHVRVPETLPQHMPPAMASYSPQTNARTLVVLGAGAAGVSAAEQLRQSGFEGEIQIVTAEEELPYRRTALSKAYLQQDESDDPPELRSPAFYGENGIDILTGKRAERVDPEAKEIRFIDGSTLTYDKLLIATGAKARSLHVPGADLKNIFTLRTAQDAKALLQSIQCKEKAVVIGSGFIGLEAASSLRQQGLAVTVVSSSPVPLEKILGKEVGKVFQQLHEENGVAFRFEDRAIAFSGKDSVQSVTLDSGQELEADVVVVGIGVEPATEFLDKSWLNEDQSVSVDDRFQLLNPTTHQPAAGTYAAGDIAEFSNPQTGEPVRIEHWRLAMQQGRVAARNMAGESAQYEGVPFFWTGQFDLKLRYVGHAEDWDDVIIDGELESREFLAFYVVNKRILAVAGCGRDREIAAISQLMRQKKMPSAQALSSEQNWLEMLD